jgi:hypothetical protein
MKPDVVVLGRFWHETGTRLASRYECRHNLLAWCQGSSPVRGWLLTMAVACSGCCTSLPYEPIGGNRYTVKGSLTVHEQRVLARRRTHFLRGPALL